MKNWLQKLAKNPPSYNQIAWTGVIVLNATAFVIWKHTEGWQGPAYVVTVVAGSSLIGFYIGVRTMYDDRQQSPKTNQRYDDVVPLMRDFIANKNRSKNFVAKIEEIVDTKYFDTPLYEELIDYLAAYNPGGGDHLYNEEELAAEFKYALEHIVTPSKK